MKILENTSQQVVVKLSREELLVISNCLNEVCNALDIAEFSTRLGAEREKVEELLREFGSGCDVVD